MKDSIERELVGFMPYPDFKKRYRNRKDFERLDWFAVRKHFFVKQTSPYGTVDMPDPIMYVRISEVIKCNWSIMDNQEMIICKKTCADLARLLWL